MTAGNWHSENNNEQKKKATLKQKTNKNFQNCTMHGGVCQSSVLGNNRQSLRKLRWWLGKQSKTGKWPCEHWLQATAMPSFLLQEWCEPPENTHAPAATVPRRPPTLCLLRAAGLTSPHQNVRWQNRKAAVCSRHLKVHLHTLPTKSNQPTAHPVKAVGVGYRDQCWDQHTCGFQLLLFQLVYVWLHFFFYFFLFFCF